MEKVIVLMSTYNGKDYLAEQIDSIINQESVSIKILIRDDGSSDSTLEIIEKYSNLYPQKIITIRGENCGFAMSFSKLVSQALLEFPDTKYFAFSDQDDVWLSDKLITAVNQIKSQQDEIKPIIYCSNTDLVNSSLQHIGFGWNPNKIKINKETSLIQNFATGCTMVFNRNAAISYVSFLPTKIRVHDFYLYQLGIFLGTVIWDHTPHILYRQHDTNQIGRPNMLGRMRNRLKGNYKRHILEEQNKNLYDSIKSQLSASDKQLFLSFIEYRSSVINRLKLLFNFKIHHTSVESDFFYRLKVLFGWV
ncbi:MAG: glycosyltransferase family 2 protein [Muribaculum sp.]|nr:glycosyltransferase family 2 protein [Muribaculum sp.]